MTDVGGVGRGRGREGAVYGVQFGFQQSIAAELITALADIVDGIIKRGEDGLIVLAKAVGQVPPGDLTATSQAGGEGGGNEAPLQTDAGAGALALLVFGQPNQVSQFLEGGAFILLGLERVGIERQVGNKRRRKGNRTTVYRGGGRRRRRGICRAVHVRGVAG